MQSRFAARAAVEAALIPDSERPFVVPGFCIACREPRDFAVTYDYAVTGPGGSRIPNWREHLVCACGLNARTRAAVHLLTTTLRAPAGARVYLMEQRSRLHDWLAERFPNLVGSEYLGDAVPLGQTVDGVRNEDATRLTFRDGQLDFVLSFDVFEHVPDFRAAFREACRVLGPGGTLLFTAPFDRGSAVTVPRARMTASGKVEHLLEPEYHGDPNAPDGRILCFQHFGWDIIEMLARAGFSHAEGRFLWSRRLGYLGDEQALFVATK
jgi:SAM-dependent methyltransferase